MIEFKTIAYKDLQEIQSLQPEGWSNIIQDIEFYINHSFCNPVKAIVNEQIAGIGTSIIFNHTAWIAHIIVGRDYRNKGIGGQIVHYLLETLRNNSIETCSLIATELGKPVYLKAGYSTVSEYLFFEREKPRINCRVSNNLHTFKEKYRSQIYELDKKISGEDRVKLLNGYLEHSILYVDNDQVSGYYIPGIKEGLIFAETPEAGLELMKLKYEKTNRAVLPSENTVACEFLRQHGFVQTAAKGTRMIVGKELNWKPEMIYSRIGGNLG
jgi:GNAT superfamily N-acetyltransferase